MPAVIECSGYAPLLHAAADLVAPGGRLVLVGVPFGEATVIPLMWVTREIEIIGSIASSAADFAVSLEMLAADPGIARVATRRAIAHSGPGGVRGVDHAFFRGEGGRRPEPVTACPAGGFAAGTMGVEATARQQYHAAVLR